jgi:hypothetical protein
MIAVIERLTIDSGPVRVNWTKGKRLFFVFFYFVRFGSFATGLRQRQAGHGPLCRRKRKSHRRRIIVTTATPRRRPTRQRRAAICAGGHRNRQRLLGQQR